jgi:hypothetical protein
LQRNGHFSLPHKNADPSKKRTGGRNQPVVAKCWRCKPQSEKDKRRTQ